MNLLTIDELSKALKVSKKTIYGWVSYKKIPFIKMGRHLRFDLQTVIAHFETKTADEHPTKSFRN